MPARKSLDVLLMKMKSLLGSNELFHLFNCLPGCLDKYLFIKHTLCTCNASMIPPLICKALRPVLNDDKLMLLCSLSCKRSLLFNFPIQIRSWGLTACVSRWYRATLWQWIEELPSVNEHFFLPLLYFTLLGHRSW